MKLPRILISRPNHDTPTETFIKNHAEYLDGDITLASGPFAYINEKPSFTPRLRSIYDTLKLAPYYLKSSDDYGDKLTTFCHINAIRKYRIQAALLEYGRHATKVMQACAKTKIPFIVHFHGVDAHQYETLKKYNLKYKKLFELASAIIVVSEPMRESLLGAGAPDSKLHRICYGVNTDLFCDAAPCDSEPICLAVGRFVEKKAPHLTILAFNKALSQCPDAKLVFIGDGPLRGACQDLTQHLNISNSVEYLGFQKPEVVASYMRKARLFVQHSVKALDGDSEGSPNSITEASASGLPVVSTFHAGIPDIVVDQMTGYLVNEKDTDGMANAMIKLLTDSNKAQTLGMAGRDHITKNLSISSQIEKLDDIIRSLL